ncbi:MAG: zinc-dependent metalloprotease, partial [Propionibacteriaceae bacterium]|nr:zinc-dependent metalloprotease [Propionibacteriaceae bacterium]
GTLAQAWSRADWLHNTLPVWRKLVSPILNSLAHTMAKLTPLPEEVEAQLAPMMRASGAAVFATQVGAALGRIAARSLSAGEVGLPLTPEPVVALIPANIEEFSAGLDLPFGDIILYLALREAARARLFKAAPWLGPQLIALVEHYAREISIDPTALRNAVEDQLGGFTQSSQFMQVGQVIADSLFNPERTPEQDEVLGRLETLVALIEGWVDAVVGQVVKDRMPTAPALAELVARRRAEAGLGEPLRSLLGLELTPRRVREARRLWSATRNYRGAAGRDGSWGHPDALPSDADLSDPLRFAEHGAAVAEPDDFDAELAKLLGETGTDPSAPEADL